MFTVVDNVTPQQAVMVGVDGVAPGVRQACVIEGCDEFRVGRGWCRMHYMRWSRNGDPNVTVKAANGTRVGCSVVDCDKPHVGRGYCGMHYVRVRKYGNVDEVHIATGPRPQARGPVSGNWKGDGCGYDGMHDRVKVRRGLASNYTCEYCPARAEEWSYDHADPDERIDGRRGIPFSLDIDRYLPLCVPCHRRLDARQKRTDI